MDLTDFQKLREVVARIVGSVQEKARQRLHELQSGNLVETSDKAFSNTIITKAGMFELLGDGTLVRFFVHVPQGPSWSTDDVTYQEMLQNPEHWHRYHLFMCKHVEVWRNNMRKSSRADGLMVYVLNNQRNGSGEYRANERKKGRSLKLCKLCRNQLPWKERINLDLSQYMKSGPFRESFEQISDFRFEDQIPNQYAADWLKVANKVKELRNWTCELCRINLGKSTNTRSFLQVHHKDRKRYNNTLTNLEALCLSCHAKFHPENPRLKNKAHELEKMKILKPEDF